MTNTELENRISVLEAEMAMVKSTIEKKQETKEPWWEQIAGTFADDAIYDEAMRLGREYRIAQREDYDKDED